MSACELVGKSEMKFRVFFGRYVQGIGADGNFHVYKSLQ